MNMILDIKLISDMKCIKNEDRFYHRAKNMEQTSRKCQKSYQFEFFQKSYFFVPKNRMIQFCLGF